MKAEIQPKYVESKIICACGNVMETNSTKPEMKVDVCSKCHPFWTGSLKQNTTGGRADKFKKKQNKCTIVIFKFPLSVNTPEKFCKICFFGIITVIFQQTEIPY